MGLGSFMRSGDDSFDSYDEFVPEHIPEPGEFLESHDVLTGMDHVGFHRLARAIFEDRGVYDMTFGYNLARLNLDARHPDAGFRYAVESPDTLCAEFTPTTEFCPQSDTLTIGAFRAFNGQRELHSYDVVRVRVDQSHHEATGINGKLRQIERTFEETGQLRQDVTGESCAQEVPTERGRDPTDAPF